MAEAALRSEERVGLVVALAVHAALVAFLLWHPRAAPVVTPPDRIEVTFSDDVGLKSTSPEPNAQAAPDVAPEIGEPAPAEPEPAPPEPVPEPVKPQPVPKPTMRPEPPKPVAKPTMRPQPRPVPKPAARPSAAPAPRPAARPVAKPSAAPARPASRPSVADAFKPTATPGGTRVGSDFLKGVSGAQAAGQSRNPPAQLTGAQRASLSAAISRALKPYWAVPQGPDADLLVTRVRFRLSRDGRLVGDPEILSTTGVTDANRAQVQRHREQAIRAIRLAQFDLPDELYQYWQTVTTIFDRKLSQ